MTGRQNNKLVLFTSDFPFGTGETFLETEINYLSKGFEEVLIISSNNEDLQTRELPENCSAERIDLRVSGVQKFGSVVGVFSKIVREERKIVRDVYEKQITWGMQKTMLISQIRGLLVAKKVNELIDRGYSPEQTVLYSYWCDDSALGLAIASQKNPEIKAVCRIHRWDVYFDQSAVGYLPYRHFIADHLRAIFSISEDGIRAAQEDWKVETFRFKLSRLGIEAQEPVLDRNDGVFTIVSCSNLIPVKRVHLIAEAVKALDGRSPLLWVHIGDGTERSRIEAILEGLSSNTQVRLMGRMPNKEVFGLYRNLAPDVFINVSSSEGVPVSIMEAMSFGIPAIATDAGGNREIVNSSSGFLIPVDCSIETLETTLLSLLNDPPLDAFRMWSDHYKASSNYSQFTTSLQSL